MFLQEQTDERQKALAIKHNRVTKLASIFARANSVLTGKRIAVNVVNQEHQKSPAWSSTNELWLNLAEIKDDLTAQSILSYQGLNFHELSHIKFSPRNGSELVKWVKENNLWQAFNCLEDNRIENLMVAYLPTVSNWLTATITDYLMCNDEAIKTAYPLVTGRRYLPIEMRNLAKDNYARPQDVDELYSIVDEYIGLIFEGNPSATEQAKPLLTRFNELLEQLPPIPNPNGGEGGEGGTTVIYRVHNPNGHNHRPTEGYESSSNRPAGKSQQEQFRDKSKAKDTSKEKVIVIDVRNDTKEGSDTSAGESKEQSLNQSSGNDFSDFNFDEQSPSDLEGGESAGNQEGTTGDNQQVTETLDGIMKDIVKELSKDINQIAKQLGISVDLEGGNIETPTRAHYKDVTANPELVLISKAFGKELERLRSNYEPYWETEVDNGRLNVTRYLDGNDFDTVFDEWQEGKDDVTSIEAVILLDKSGSMSGENSDNAYKSMWAIKKALEQVEARTTVCLFDSRTTLLYSADERAGSTIRDSGASGGTNPCDSLLYAKKVLADTDKKIRILFMITDGAWETEAGEKAITEMRNAGVLTCQAYLDSGEARKEYLEKLRHSFELLTHIKSAKDIAILGKELVRLAIARNLINH
jgi:hypothetical protein